MNFYETPAFQRALVSLWNERFRNEGWQSKPMDAECLFCRQPRLVRFTTIYGKTTAHCDVCAHSWEVEA